MPGSFTSLARIPLGGVPFAEPARTADLPPLPNVGRRSAPRLRLSIPARLVTVSETRRCVLIDLSRGGVQIGLPRPLAVGDVGFLTFAGLEVFGGAVHAGKGHNGIEFDVELTDEEVLATRRYAESFETEERRALLNEARAWVTGTGKI